MREDQIEAIHSAIVELEEEDALVPGTPPGYFARFSIAEQEPWIEVVLAKATVVNLWYPFDEEPLSMFREIDLKPPDGFQMIVHDNPSCTFSVPRCPVPDLARFVDQLFMKLYASDENYALEIEMCAFE